MTKIKTKKKTALWISSLCALCLAFGLVACSSGSNDGSEATESTDEEATSVETPEADEYGVVLAASWAEIYPDQYETYLANEENSPDSGKHDYLELYPALNTMYLGYAFALGYDEASSHVYSLTSVTESPRTTEKEQLAGCITCKTPQFTALVAEEGEEIYLEAFNDLISDFTEPISCYNCHENDPETLNVTGTYFIEALGDDYGEDSAAPMASQVCGQCHNEYYFDPTTKATTNPYTGLSEMTPDAILAYYDEMDYSDWRHGSTYAPMIKVQHPEFETMYGGDMSYMASLGYSCADCHMGTTTNEDGEEYTSHTWVSPLENEELIENDCSNCHEDLVAEVTAIQEEEEERVTAISEKIEEMTNLIAEQYADEITAMQEAAANEEEVPEASDELSELWTLQRNAQYYWDFVMVENSEGAHNPDLTEECLDKAEAYADEALELLS